MLHHYYIITLCTVKKKRPGRWSRQQFLDPGEFGPWRLHLPESLRLVVPVRLRPPPKSAPMPPTPWGRSTWRSSRGRSERLPPPSPSERDFQFLTGCALALCPPLTFPIVNAMMALMAPRRAGFLFSVFFSVWCNACLLPSRADHQPRSYNSSWVVWMEIHTFSKYRKHADGAHFSMDTATHFSGLFC